MNDEYKCSCGAIYKAHEVDKAHVHIRGWAAIGEYHIFTPPLPEEKKDGKEADGD